MKKLLLFVISIIGYLAVQSQIITTIAGGNGDGGWALNTSISSPYGVTLDSKGNIYILVHQQIRKVNVSTGILSTVAGNGNQGFDGDGGLAIHSSLNNPSSLTFDSIGNIYIADGGNHRIRKVNAGTGIISTIAGNGVPSFSGDLVPAISASLNFPGGVSINQSGDLFIADLANYRIRKVDLSTGLISTVAGNGKQGYGGDDSLATNATLNFPSQIVFDKYGNLIIADRYSNVIRKINVQNGIISTIVGSGIQGFGGDGASATKASLNSPIDIAFDAFDNMYILDQGNNRVRKVNPQGVISTIVGNGKSGYNGDSILATAASFNIPSGMAIDTAGNIYIADRDNNRIRKVDFTTGIIKTIVGNGTTYFGGDGGDAKSACFSKTESVATDTFGNIYITDYYNNRIRKVNASTGIINTIVGDGTQGFKGDSGEAAKAWLNNPVGVSLDGFGNLFIVDERNVRIRKVDLQTGIITTIAGNGGQGYNGDGIKATEASLNSPSSIAIDGNGNLYIGDYGNYRVRKVDAKTGIISTFAGNGNDSYNGDGILATSASIDHPYGVTLDVIGNVYITDSYNNRVRKVDVNTNIISTVAGNGKYGMGGDGGPATSANLSFPTSVAINVRGDLFIADQYNNLIRKVNAGTGIITTLAGNGKIGGDGDGGLAINASLNYPSCVVIDRNGNLIIADKFNGRIRKVTMDSLNSNTKEVLYKPNLRIYPNPATSALNIEAEANGKLFLQLFDIAGKEASQRFEFVHSTNINTQDLHEGIYFLKITDENGTFVKTEKVMVLR